MCGARDANVAVTRCVGAAQSRLASRRDMEHDMSGDKREMKIQDFTILGARKKLLNKLSECPQLSNIPFGRDVHAEDLRRDGV